MYELKSLENGFEYIEIKNSVSSAKIALQGAHVYEYKRKGKPDILWLSESSAFEYGTAIRGGIPICWPRFGVIDKSMPAHGFSRTALFSFKSAVEIDDATTKVTLTLKDSIESREIWNYKFELEVVFVIGKTLTVSMNTHNLDTKDFFITEALHTYLSVSDINDVTIFGLENREFIDTLCDEKRSEKVALQIESECDRVYESVDNDIELRDVKRSIVLNAKGSNSTVVWNPWIEKGSRVSGMRADAYREFVCIETANAFDGFRVVKPEESHTLSVTFMV